VQHRQKDDEEDEEEEKICMYRVALPAQVADDGLWAPF
jgi:hypothetical protein